MLLKHPACYKHQIAFTFSGAKRDFYNRTREKILTNSSFKELSLELSIEPGDLAVFLEDTWGTVTAREFYSAYRNAVLVVVLFDENYMKSTGAYPEWSIIQDMRGQLQGRILPVKFGDIPDMPIKNDLFLGLIDLTHVLNDNERIDQLQKKIVDVWSKSVSSWRTPADDTIICFEGSIPDAVDNARVHLLPKLCWINRDKIYGEIAKPQFWVDSCPTRTTSVYAPSECRTDWDLFESVIGRLSQNYSRHRRNSMRVPVFVDDGVIANTTKLSLRETIWQKSGNGRKYENGWERDFRLWSDFTEWRNSMSRMSLVNILASSDCTTELAFNLAQRQQECKNENLIVNLWRWQTGSVFSETNPYSIDMHGMHHTACNAQANLIHLSDGLRMTSVNGVKC